MAAPPLTADVGHAEARTPAVGRFFQGMFWLMFRFGVNSDRPGSAQLVRYSLRLAAGLGLPSTIAHFFLAATNLSNSLFGGARLEARMDTRWPRAIGSQAMWCGWYKLRPNRQRPNANVLISNCNHGGTRIDIIVDLRPNFDRQLCKCFGFKPFDPNANRRWDRCNGDSKMSMKIRVKDGEAHQRAGIGNGAASPALTESKAYAPPFSTARR